MDAAALIGLTKGEPVSKKKSDLAQRYPIDSTGELLVDHAKYNRRDDTFWRAVVTFELTADRKTATLTLECGHKRVVRRRGRKWWEDEVPGNVRCGVCVEDEAFLREEARRNR